jgi:hypothetical protein
VRVEWVRHDTLHLGRNIRRSRDRAAEIEQAQPAGRYACEEEMRRLWQEAHRRDRFGGSMLLEDAGVDTGPQVSAGDLRLRATCAWGWLDLDVVVGVRI